MDSIENLEIFDEHEDASCLESLEKALTIEEQIENLKEKNLQIYDENFAKDILGKISYYRLIKAFSLTFKNKNCSYNGNISFRQLVNLYKFNADFCSLIFRKIGEIEIIFRCKIGNYFSLKYKTLGYLDNDNFLWADETSEIAKRKEPNGLFNRRNNPPFVNLFLTNYKERELPLYAMMEIISFGTLSKFYKHMKNEDKSFIAKEFGDLGYRYIENWLHNLTYVRNVCAHHSRLYNLTMAIPVKLPKEGKNIVECNRIFATLLAMKNILCNITEWNGFVDDLVLISKKYPDAKLDTMGFPINWKSLLYVKK